MAQPRQTCRAVLADAAVGGSVASRLRARRYTELLRRFPDLAEMRVLDLGGTPAFWAGVPARPASLVLLNVLDPDALPSVPRAGGARPGGARTEGPAGAETDGVEIVHGDACDPPDSVMGRRFDLVVSNSVIEHVGGHARREQFAATVSKLAPHHWIQTPNRYFPIEPHWIFPAMQFLPVPARAAVVRRWPLAPAHPVGRDAVAAALSVELLTQAQMRYYFRDSELLHERVAGLTKSLIAVA